MAFLHRSCLVNCIEPFVVNICDNCRCCAESKYCPLVERDRGIDLLTRFCHDDRSPQHVRLLAQKVISRCRHFNASDGSYQSDDESSPEMEDDEQVVDDEQH